MNQEHSYFQFAEKPRAGVIPNITKDILEFYSRKRLSKKKWLKEPAFFVEYQHRKSIPIDYSCLAESMHTKHQFSIEDWDLPNYECFWLDSEIKVQINCHKFDKDTPDVLAICIEFPKQMYGQSFPISPQLDREGHVLSSMQGSLVERIIRLRQKLVLESNRALTLEWVFDLRALISDTISLVEITLHQIYTKAEYDPLPGWVFDKARLGEKFGRRIIDKLKWIHQITGIPLDNARDEIYSLNNLRRIRNHMMHFDPPCLVVPLEEVELWFNQVLDIAFLLCKFRNKLNLPISTALANFMLQKDVIFTPELPFQSRLPLESKRAGYLSSCWPEEQEENYDQVEYTLCLEQEVSNLAADPLRNDNLNDSTSNSRSRPRGFGNKHKRNE